jgi:hypothetical protein
MKKTTRTALSFKEDQMPSINELKKALAIDGPKELSSREIFLLAMAYGYSAKNKVRGWKRNNNGPRLEYMQPRDETLIAALSISEHDNPSCLRETEAVYDLAEDYAAGGIVLFATALSKERNFHSWIEAEVFQAFQSAKEAQDAVDA